jgi:hypothetical protein
MKTIWILLLVLMIPYGVPAKLRTLNSADSAGHYIKPVRGYRVPSINQNTLFYIQRDPNSNTIFYELNVDPDGQLNKANPVHVYWVKYNERGQQEELNFIQRKFAYGVNVKMVNNDDYDITFVSYKKYPLELMRTQDGKYHIFANIDNKKAILKSVFVRIEGGSFWIPNILYVEVKGIDPETGKEITGRFKP